MEERGEHQDGNRLALVLLAAGESRRFGGNKLLHELNGKPMYQYILEQIQGLPSDMIGQKLLVTQYEDIRKEAETRGFLTVENKNSRLGISHSLHLGLQALDDRADAVMFAVCDQPWLRQATIWKLITEWRQSGKGIACLGYQGEPGNPVIFSKRYYKELLELTGDTGGKRVLCRHMDDVWISEAEEQELKDMDTRE